MVSLKIAYDPGIASCESLALPVDTKMIGWSKENKPGYKKKVNGCQ